VSAGGGARVGPVVLVCSPHSGSACPPEEIVAALDAAGVDVAETIPVSRLPEEPQGPRWQELGVRAVIGAGGDGTLGTVATHIDDSDLALGILPLGTANDTARSLDVPLDLPGAAAVIGAGYTSAIDVGEVTDDQGRRARFLHATTLGLNAEFARLATDVERRKRLGPLNYPASALAALANSRSRATVIRFDDGRIVEGPALQVGALNLPHLLGGTLDIQLPNVGPRDGQLTFLVVRGLLAIDRYQATSARIETETPDEVTIDGELMFHTPVQVALARRRLRVFVPQAPPS
jgi:diacylglycerol kinase family enzyme